MFRTRWRPLVGGTATALLISGMPPALAATGSPGPGVKPLAGASVRPEHTLKHRAARRLQLQSQAPAGPGTNGRRKRWVLR